MNNYLLLEIGVEELPSRFGQTTLDQIENNLSKLLKEERKILDKYFEKKSICVQTNHNTK